VKTTRKYAEKLRFSSIVDQTGINCSDSGEAAASDAAEAV
jgi:hypothetical protein